MTWLRSPVVRSGCAGLAIATTVSLNLSPAVAESRHRSATAREQIREMGEAIDRAAARAIPPEPIPTAAAPVQSHPAKSTQKPAEPPAASTKQSPQSSGETSAGEAATSAAPAAFTEAPFTIRVRVGKAAQGAIQFATSTAATIRAGNQAFQLAPSTLYTAVSSAGGIQVGNLTVSTLEVDPGENGYVFVGDRWYYGKLHLIVSDEGLIAVNELPLEAYLYSVVGAEMPTSWNPEALKAQAVAARSYAVAHLERPASGWYNLGDDERWQAYKGAESMDQSSIAAVQSTLGQVLSIEGRIYEAQYASTEEISREAHGGRGMSQHGAQSMAQSGNSYLQILGRYYAGTALATLMSATQSDPGE